MIKEKTRQQIYHNRLAIILKHFESRVNTIVGGLKSIDVSGTAASIN